jgi:hypothetical protein
LLQFPKLKTVDQVLEVDEEEEKDHLVNEVVKNIRKTMVTRNMDTKNTVIRSIKKTKLYIILERPTQIKMTASVCSHFFMILLFVVWRSYSTVIVFTTAYS